MHALHILRLVRTLVLLEPLDNHKPNIRKKRLFLLAAVLEEQEVYYFLDLFLSPSAAFQRFCKFYHGN